jgi:uncharacterized protein involved in response to NO
MSTVLAQIESRPAPARNSAAAVAVRETRLSRLLIAYISTGLAFMLLPGTFLGVWNLFAISSRRAPGSVSSAWVQAHGHAQIFGWIGTFILGIGFYSIPKLRRTKGFALPAAWTSWALWTAGVSLRWVAGMYQWHWRTLLPVSAVFELAAFLIFFRCVSGHRPEGTGERKLDAWVLVVIAGSVGLLLALLANAGAALWLASTAASPELASEIDQRLLVLQTWGCLVPTVWGFSARWLPVFLGLRAVRARVLLRAVAANAAGVAAALAGWSAASAVLLAAGIATAIHALRLIEPAERPAKIEGVHSSYPIFIRLAYGWAAVAAALGIWSAFAVNPTGIAGASRHALTVGFLALMVFAVGQRVLPAFSGMKLLFSRNLMFASLALLAGGCLLRVASEVLAYQHFAGAAWRWLPVSAVLEMTAVSAFAVNLWVTFARPRSAAGA